MLVPLTRQKFEQLIPSVATGGQYLYAWGKARDFLRRALFSVIAVVIVWFPLNFLGDNLQLVVGLIAGLYWLWWPAVQASLQNQTCRRLPYSGLWQGYVLDVFISEELIGKEETVNRQGELVVIQSRERRLNLEVGDDTGFSTRLQVPLKRDHRVIRPDDTAQLLLMSNRPDLSRINKISDLYLPDHNLWVSDYPYLQRDVFEQMSRSLRLGDSEKRRGYK
uniref:Phosphate ABC transporter permease n=1 Tax=Cyanothece sp. (strain PCC 7425 / ATCC 29141) TaxID=395961 RepID=B8HWW6_CYAP4